jgi:hypothetical protein
MSNKVKEARGKKLVAPAIQVYRNPYPNYGVIYNSTGAVKAGIYSCREDFCASFKNSLNNVRKDAYAIFMCGSNKKEAERLLERMDRNLALMNSIEERLMIEVPTSATVYYMDKLATSKRAIETAKEFNRVPMILVVELDEIWTSAPALLSLHSLLMRLHHKLRADQSYTTLAGFEKAQITGNLQSPEGAKLPAAAGWIFMMENLLDIFPVDRTYEQNWRYRGFSGTHGIRAFMRNIGDKEAAGNFQALWDVKKK